MSGGGSGGGGGLVPHSFEFSFLGSKYIIDVSQLI